jgi:hypothetical protein
MRGLEGSLRYQRGDDYFFKGMSAILSARGLGRLEADRTHCGSSELKTPVSQGFLIPASRTLFRVWGWRAGERYP